MKRIITESLLVAEDSSRKAFYRLFVEKVEGGYVIRKVSGAHGRILHEEMYWRPDINSAVAFFRAKIASKTSPERRSPRKYRVIHETQARADLPATVGE